MSPAEFWQALDAHSREKEADRIHTGELARGMAVRIFNLLVDPKHRISHLPDFWAMPWDDVTNNKKDSEEARRLSSLDGEGLKNEVELFYKRLNNGKRTESKD